MCVVCVRLWSVEGKLCVWNLAMRVCLVCEDVMEVKSRLWIWSLVLKKSGRGYVCTTSFITNRVSFSVLSILSVNIYKNIT